MISSVLLACPMGPSSLMRKEMERVAERMCAHLNASRAHARRTGSLARFGGAALKARSMRFQRASSYMSALEFLDRMRSGRWQECAYMN